METEEEKPIEIKGTGGAVLLSTKINKGSKRKFELMKDDYITLKFTLDKPVDFPLGTYVECDFGRFEVVDPQSPSWNTKTGGYDYELKMEAAYRKWKNKLFKYNPETAEDTGGEASWSLTAPLETHMGVFLRCLKAWGYTCGGEAYAFLPDSTVTTENLFLTYSNTNLIDALTMMAEAAGCEWWVRGADIRFGRLANDKEAVTLQAGVNTAPMTLSKSSGEYFTRIYAFGSTENVSPRYRKTLEFTADETGIYTGFIGGQSYWYVRDSQRPVTPAYFAASQTSRSGWFPSTAKAAARPRHQPR